MTSLKIGGCFLVTDSAFENLFSSIGSQLTELCLQEAAKLCTAFEKLVEHGQRLKYLTLKRCTKLGDDQFKLASKLPNLRKFKMIEPGNISDEAIQQMLEGIGPKLQELSLSGYAFNLHDLSLVRFNNMTDQILESLLKCEQLTHLSLKNCTSLTSPGLESFFARHPLKLKKLNLCRLVHIEDSVIATLLAKIKNTIEYLNLNALDELTTLKLEGLSQLKRVDVSWIRCIDDETLLDLEKGDKLEEIKCYGCLKISRGAGDRIWENKNGQVIRVKGIEYD